MEFPVFCLRRPRPPIVRAEATLGSFLSALPSGPPRHIVGELTLGRGGFDGEPTHPKRLALADELARDLAQPIGHVSVNGDTLLLRRHAPRGARIEGIIFVYSGEPCASVEIARKLTDPNFPSFASRAFFARRADEAASILICPCPGEVTLRYGSIPKRIVLASDGGIEIG